MERQQPAVHRTIVVVDVEGFGDRRRTNTHQVVVRDGVYRALRQAFGNAGVPWNDCDHEDRGDGVFILVPAEIPKAPFVEVIPPALVAALHKHNTGCKAEERIRLRMALHAGEVVYDEHGVTAASVNLTFRLLDSSSLKAALAASPGVLALITSELFFDEVVRHISNPDPDTFRPVRVAVKETTTTGWISLPDHPYPPGTTNLTAAPAEESAGQVPHQLPAAPHSFTGRDDDLARLSAALDTGVKQGGTVVISALAGAGGMGKTWLALQWAHQHIDDFPDGQLFVDLRGFSPDGQAMAVGAALRGFLDALGAIAPVPADVHAQAARYRSLVAGKRLLIVLDNAADTTQVIPLLPGTPTCTVLVTSRNHLPGLLTGHDARHLPVDVLTDTEARALLITRLGSKRIAAEPAPTDEILACCGGFPLALSIVAGRAQTHSHLPLATLAAELREAGIGAFGQDDPLASLPTVLSWSYRALTRDQARVFGLLGIAPGPDISLPAAASLTGLSTSQTRSVLRGLEQASLLTQDTTGRYRMHDLIRLYAAEHAAQDLTEADQHVALRRLIYFFLLTAHTGARLLDPNRPPIQTDPPPPGCRPLALSDPAAAMEWFDTEYACLRAIQQAASARWHQAVWQLAWTLTTYHRRRGRLQDNLSAWQAGLTSADHVDEPATKALTLRLLGDACIRADRHSEAMEHLRQALTLSEHIGDLPNQAHTHRAISWAWAQSGNDRRALEHAVHALRLFQTLDNPVWEADARNAAGWCGARLGEYDQARTHCEIALNLYRGDHNRAGEANTLNNLGYIAHHAGHHTHAVDYYQQALTLFRDIGNVYFEAQTLERLGHTHLALGHHDLARTVQQEALKLYQAQHRVTDADRVQQQLEAAG